ncbi:hypothetical protein [Streptomyces sp. NPDC088812]|uniref:hypothetical protein n=1 Tax=Streptomyces sp. NPDC088812 TaxID=3365905 RepID=UPI003807D2C3
MTSPRTPRPAQGLPQRVPGSSKKVSPSPRPPEDTDARQGGALPRLTQYSSLGSRAGFNPPQQQTPAPGPAPAPAEPGRTGGLLGRSGDRSGRAASRGALGVVGVVGLLAAGSVALLLVLTGQDDGEQRGGASVSAEYDYDDHDVDDIVRPGSRAEPSASASAHESGDKDGDEAGPSASARSTGGASGKASKIPD